MRTHTGENLQKCDICFKPFTNSYSLKVHRETHDTSKLEIPCDTCQKTFRNEKNLKRHIATVHLKNELKYVNLIFI